MGTRGTLLLKAILDTKTLASGLRGLVATVSRENETIARNNARFQTTLTREIVKQDELRAKSAARVSEVVNKGHVSQLKTLKELANVEKAETQAAQASLRLRIEQERQEARLQQQQQRRARQQSAFAAAVYSTRINLPGGAAPLVGRSLAAAGLDLSRRSTLAIGTAIAGAGTAVAAAGPVLSWLDEATKKASDLNESVNKSQVIFKTSSSEIEKWADSAVKNIGQTKTQAIDAAASFGNLFNAAGFSLSESAKKSEDIVGRATDLSSLFNTTSEEALRSLQSGLQGEVEPLRKFGVFVSEARVKAEAFALGLGKVPPNADKVRQANEAVAIATAKAGLAIKKYGEGSTEAASANLTLERANNALEKALSGSKAELTDQQKIQARLSIIMKDSAVAAGDFARTSGELANKSRQVTAQIDDLQAKIGKDFLPLKKDFLGFFSDGLGVVNDLKDGIGNLVSRIEAADNADFGMGPGIKRLLDNLRAIQEILHINADLARQQATTEGKAADLGVYRSALDGLRKGTLSPEDAEAAQDLLRKRGILKGNDNTLRNAIATPYGAANSVLGASRPDLFDTDVQARRTNAETALMRGITEATRAFNALSASNKPAAIEGGDYTDRFRSSQEEAGTGTNNPSKGNKKKTFSGADRNREAAAAKRAAEKQRKAAERAAKEAQQASVKLTQTELRGQLEDFKGTLTATSNVKAGYGAADSIDTLVQTARGQNKALKDAEVAAALKRYEAAKKVNAKAAKIGLTESYEIARQNYEKREATINEQKQKAQERILKESKSQAAVAERSTRDDIQVYEQSRQHYRDFLQVEEDELKDAQEMATRRGQFSRSTELLQSLFDNKRRQITEQYRDDLQNAGGDDNAIAAATRRRDLAAAQAKRESDKGIADNILLGTSSDIKYGASDAINRLFRSSANGDNSLEALQGTFESLGQTAGSAFADYANRRFVEGPLNKFFDDIAAKIVGSGAAAGQGIMQGANFFASVIGLLFQQNNKKKSGGLFGGLLGGLVGFAIGGPAGALTGFTAGAQAGQGNYLGAGLTLLTGFSGGGGGASALTTKGGNTLGGGGALGGGGSFGAGGFSGLKYAAGGYPPVGLTSLFGDGGGPEAMFGETGRVTLLGLGGHQEYRPTGRSVVLPADASARLVQAAASTGKATATSSGEPTSGGGVTIQYYGDIHDRMDVEIADREIKNKRRREALVN